MCYTFCGNPTANTNNIEIGYNTNVGVESWVSLSSQSISGNSGACISLDLPELPSGTTSNISIGIRITADPEDSVTYFVDTLTLTENICGVEVVERDRDWET